MNTGTEVTASSPIAEHWCGRSDAAWYCVRTHLKHEHIAAAHLGRIPGVETFNPQLRILRSTRRGPRWATEALFPNYVFARFPLEALFEKVRYTPAVKFVVRFGDRVPEVPDVVVETLREDLAGLQSEVLTDAPIKGEEVEIAGGAFVGTKGLVANVVPGKQRVQILLDIMGRSVPAELSLDLVLFNRRQASAVALKHAQTLAAESPAAHARRVVERGVVAAKTTLALWATEAAQSPAVQSVIESPVVPPPSAGQSAA